MGKLSLNRITSNYGFQKSLNAMMKAIEEEFEKVLYRDNPSGATNTMSNDLDMSEYDLLNVGVVNARTYLVNGGDLSTTIEESMATAAALASRVEEYKESAEANATLATNAASMASTSATSAAASAAEASAFQAVTSDDLAYWNQKGRENLIINGNFLMWQRAPSQTASGIYSDDRWSNIHDKITKVHSIVPIGLTESFTDGGDTPSYASSTKILAISDITNAYCIKQQFIELYNVEKAAHEVVVSFYAKASTAGLKIGVEFEQVLGGVAPVNNICSETVTLTTSWKRYTITASIPSLIGKTITDISNCALVLNFWFAAGSAYATRSGGVGCQTGTFVITGVQLEKGNVASPYRLKPVSQEVRDCLRYYERTYCHARFYASAASQIGCSAINFAVPKRKIPTLTAISGGVSDLCTGYALAPAAGGFRYEVVSTAAGNCYSLNKYVAADAEF